MTARSIAAQTEFIGAEVRLKPVSLVLEWQDWKSHLVQLFILYHPPSQTSACADHVRAWHKQKMSTLKVVLNNQKMSTQTRLPGKARTARILSQKSILPWDSLWEWAQNATNEPFQKQLGDGNLVQCPQLQQLLNVFKRGGKNPKNILGGGGEFLIPVDQNCCTSQLDCVWNCLVLLYSLHVVYCRQVFLVPLVFIQVL